MWNETNDEDHILIAPVFRLITKKWERVYKVLFTIFYVENWHTKSPNLGNREKEKSFRIHIQYIYRICKRKIVWTLLIVHKSMCTIFTWVFFFFLFLPFMSSKICQNSQRASKCWVVIHRFKYEYEYIHISHSRFAVKKNTWMWDMNADECVTLSLCVCECVCVDKSYNLLNCIHRVYVCASHEWFISHQV